MDQILHNPSVWVLFSFLIFAGFAWRMGKDVFFSAIDARIEFVRKEIETARALRAQAQALFEEYEKKREQALLEAEAILVKARENAEHIRSQADTALAETLRRREEALAERIRRMEDVAIQDIRERAACLSIEAARRILREKLDQDAGGLLADRSFEDVARHIAH
ncbi:MAG: ATP synthase F0 subunit B [Rhodospirillales bacterium]|nr:ATP synthase F0 subunit B [Rhodospirillales bacterium]